MARPLERWAEAGRPSEDRGLPSARQVAGWVVRRWLRWAERSAGPERASPPQQPPGRRRGPESVRAALLLLALLGLSACSRPGRPAPGPVTLRFWAMGHEGDVVAPMVREFEKLNPGIRVELQQIPWTAAHEKLLTAFVGEATPDVAQIGNTWIPEFTAIDALLPLDSLVAASPTLHAADFFRGIWDTNVIGDSVYGIPWYVDTRLVFYRTDLLAKAGYPSFPKTWADWLRAMERLKAQGGAGRWAILLPINEWPQPMIMGMATGGTVLGDSGRYGAFESPAFERGYTFYVDLFRRGLAPAVSNNDISNIFQEFARGTFAMYISGPWYISEFRNRLPDSLQTRWGTAPMPSPDTSWPGISMAGGSSLSVFRHSRHAAAAWKLIEFLSRPDRQRQFYHLTGDLPPSLAAWRDSSLVDNPYAHAFWLQLQRVRPLPKVPEIELISNTLADYGEKIIRGGMPVDAAMKALDSDVDAVLAKRRWMLARQSAGGAR